MVPLLSMTQNGHFQGQIFLCSAKITYLPQAKGSEITKLALKLRFGGIVLAFILGRDLVLDFKDYWVLECFLLC